MSKNAANEPGNDIKRIQGMREYLWPESEILFVQNRLPLKDSRTPVFGSAARKVWWALHEAGLVTRLFDDPMEAEKTVFEAGQCIAGDHHWSIITLCWNSEVLSGNIRFCYVDWNRAEKVSAALKANKVVYLGKKLATEGGRDWQRSGMRPANPFGYLRDNLEYGHSSRRHGLPLTDIGPESLRYFMELR
jgi:hypothetical protein